jgi:polyphosphate glucokinase
MKLLGIDIGGSGVKGAIVDTRKGVFVTDRTRVETPQPATPDAVTKVIRRIADHLDWEGPAGITFPGVVSHGEIHTAANLDASWIGVDAGGKFSKAVGGPVAVLNDADAAGVAEQAFGAAVAVDGTVVVVTLGTGIGTALISDGHLVPNLELGHLTLNGGDAERYASEAVRDREALSFEDWASRLTEYFTMLEDLVWPDLFVVGGGISKNPDPWLPLIKCRTRVVTARLRNRAGIVGAALQAERSLALSASRRRRG